MLSNKLSKSNINNDMSDYRKHQSSDYSAANQLVGDINLEEIVDNLNILFLEHFNRPLNTVESMILAGVWQKKTYSEMAKENNYSPNYFSNVMAPRLLKQLSIMLEYSVTKKNCRSIITGYLRKNILNNLQAHKIKGQEDRTYTNSLNVDYR